MPGIVESSRSAHWSVAYLPGELSSMEVAMTVLDYLEKRKKDADTAKVFQGSVDGAPAVYIVSRYK